MGANIRSTQVRANVAANVRAHGQPIGEGAGLVGLDVPAVVDSGDDLAGLLDMAEGWELMDELDRMDVEI